MQRRSDSAYIVSNPSRTKRNSNSIHRDSTCESHNELVQFDTFPFTSCRQHTVSATDLDLSYSARSGGYVCLSTLTKAGAQRRTSYGLRVSHTPTAIPATYPSPVSNSEQSDSSYDTSSASICTGSMDGREHRLPTPPPNSHSSLSLLPTLSKETVKQYSYVDSLVDVATIITHTLWPCEDTMTPRKAESSIRMISYFITETSRKSKTSLSTMQLALLYCIRFKRDQDRLTQQIAQSQSSAEIAYDAPTLSVGSTCARRNFLSALILASKYLQDRNFSNKAWSKISSISIAEINLREREFLEITKWNLDVKHDVFKHWSSMMGRCINETRHGTIFGELQACQSRWRLVIRRMMHVTDDQMNHIMVSAISSNSSTRKLDQKTEVREVAQLHTPINTPAVELHEFTLPASATSMPAVSLVTPNIDTSTEELDTPDCPFFNEFIKSTPRDQTVCEETIEHGPGETTAQAHAHYGTPDSMRIDSPTSSDFGASREVSEVDVGTCSSAACGLPQNLVPSYEESVHVPPTPLIRPYTSFTALSESFLVQQRDTKRSMDELDCDQCPGEMARGKKVRLYH